MVDSDQQLNYKLTVLHACGSQLTCIDVSETRAESIGCYGHPFVQTPNLDGFAAQGTRFDQAHVLHTQCAPSRCAITTGRYMHVLGHRTQTHLVQNYEPNMFRYLKEANYTVLWYGKNDMLSADSFNSSVTDWKGLIGVSQGGNAFQFGEAGYYSFLSTPSDIYGNSTKNGDYQAVVTTLDFIRNDPPEPFMIFLPGIGSHPPYGAPKDYHNKYSAEEVSDKSPLRPPNLPNKPKYHTGIIKYRNLTSFNQSFFDKINAIYLGRVSYVDWVFGQLVDGIDASPVGNRTAIFMSSDHGDFAGDFHLVEKWPGGVDDILTRVPMLVRIPGGTKGHVVKEPINSFDMMATVLEMANVEVKHVHFAQSFLSQLHGAEGNSSRTVYSEGGFLYHNEIEPYDRKQQQLNDPKNLYYERGQEEIHEGSPRVVMARTMDHKLAYRPDGISELYDLKKDPRELSNVYMDKDYADIRNQMESDLLRWMVETGDVTPLVEDNRGLPPSPHS
jgi:choline-sulfatase